MTILLLIRHGENDLVGKQLAGRLPDIHLNTNGQDQALNIAKHLKDTSICEIHSSPLERALETAMPLSGVINIPIIKNENLIEIDYGEWQGKKLQELYKLQKWNNLINNAKSFSFPGGESLEIAQRRCINEIKNILSKKEAEDIVACFTHADMIRLSIAHFLRMNLNDYHRLIIHPASISIVNFTNNFPEVLALNFIINKKNSLKIYFPDK